MPENCRVSSRFGTADEPSEISSNERFRKGSVIQLRNDGIVCKANQLIIVQIESSNAEGYKEYTDSDDNLPGTAPMRLFDSVFRREPLESCATELHRKLGRGYTFVDINPPTVGALHEGVNELKSSVNVVPS